jgi:uncharacterized protein YciI
VAILARHRAAGEAHRTEAARAYGVPMKFDSFTVVLLALRDDAPILDRAATGALQDAHLSYLADLHDSGALLAAGPLLGDETRAFSGLNMFKTDLATAIRLAASDPAVIAGRFAVVAQSWAVPSGAMTFKHARLPRSMADLDDETDEIG